jgi:hypothetical protein
MSDLLTQLGITKDDLIDRVVDKVLGFTSGHIQTGEDMWEDVPLAKEIDNKIHSAIGSLVKAAEPMIQSRITTIMDAQVEAIFSAPFYRRDQWGGQTGVPTTIRDMIYEQSEKYWITEVDENGKVGNGYSKKMARAEWYAMGVMKKVYDSELTEVVKKMADELAARIPKTIGDEITKTVIKHLK